MRYILTSQPAAQQLALSEAGDARVVRQLVPGVALCANVQRPEHPVFLRHMSLAVFEVTINGDTEDLNTLRDAFMPLLHTMSPATGSFSVQTRIMEGFQPHYKPFDVNQMLSAMAQAEGLELDVRNPQQVVSVTLIQGLGWLGVSSAEENISAWAGGMRRFKWEQGQISRAEFKLLEALETFAVPLADGQRAIDLGAAPGGWTRILRRRGLYVAAVDPADLDARLKGDKRLTHYRKTAQAFFREDEALCDIMVNDMKMDSRESALLMVQGAKSVKPGGKAILTLKLPEDASGWNVRVQEARQVLSEAYEWVEARQLFHNRNEVTVYLLRKDDGAVL